MNEEIIEELKKDDVSLDNPKDFNEERTFKIYGYSEGDRSVGIGTIQFEIDTGVLLENYDDKDKQNFKEKNLSRTKLIKSFEKRLKEFNKYDKKISYLDYLYLMTKELIEELHDNGRLHISDNWINKEEW